MKNKELENSVYADFKTAVLDLRFRMGYTYEQIFKWANYHHDITKEEFNDLMKGVY